MRCSNRPSADPSDRHFQVAAARNDRGQALICAMLGLVALVGLACSSAPPPAEQWTASFVEPPDRVWVAINQTLEDLGYEVDEADRHNSIVIATSGTEGTDPPVVLRVAQVARTEVVRVHVTSHDGDADADRFGTAAREFLSALEATMQGNTPQTETDDP